jgi:hypothetical protein
MPLNARTAAFVLGVVFLIFGALGYLPNALVGHMGNGNPAFFATNNMHNLIHLISGIFLLLGVYSSLGPSLALKILGVVYAIIAILGFVTMGGGSGLMFGIVEMNMMDHYLHVVLAIVILIAGFGLPRGPRTA